MSEKLRSTGFFLYSERTEGVRKIETFCERNLNMFRVPPHRRFNPMDYIFHLWKGYMQYSIEFDDAAAVKPAIEEIIRCMNGFCIRGGYIWLYEAKQKIPIYSIPSNIETLEEVNEWMYLNHTPGYRKAFATIAADESRRRIVVNSSHMLNDGVFIAQLLEHLSKPEEYGTRNKSPIPWSHFDYFKKQIHAHPHVPVASEDGEICRVRTKGPLDKRHPMYKIQYVREPIENLANYNPKKRKCEKMSEALWVAIGLSNCAHRGEISPFGLSTVLDLRRVTSKKDLKNTAIQNWIASISVHANLKREMTINELGREMRNDFERKKARNDQFGNMRTIYDVVYKPWITRPVVPGLGLEMSSIGCVNIKSPVKDIHITLSTPANYDLVGVSVMSYTVNHPNKREFVGEIQYTTRELNPIDARQLGESIRYCLKNFKGPETCGYALDTLTELQKTIH